MTPADVRRIALSLPETTEQPHHEIVSFRVRGRILATLPDRAHVRVMADEPAIRAAVATHADSCAAFYWGERLACVAIELRTVDPALVRDLLVNAWQRKAPAKLRAIAYTQWREFGE